MTEFDPVAWLWWTGLVTSASAAGYGLARRMPWLAEARNGSLELAFGVCLGPFLCGLGGVAVLGLLPGIDPRIHLGIVLCMLVSICLAATFWPSRDGAAQRADTNSPLRRMGGIAWVASQALVLGWISLLFFEALFLPLVANDALEYATVGRLLFETRNLLDYPAIDPQRGSSGFFAPWTHPPLYAAQLYLAYAAQGHADMPGLGRTVAPWFFMGAALLVRAMGDFHGRFIGLLAMLLFLSTPLALEGAAAASIDALTMAGAALVLCGVALLNLRGGCWQIGVLGALVGLCLWAHSSAVVMLPISVAAVWVMQGVVPTMRHVRTAGVLVLVALIVAAWPYGRNLLLFGTVISDNPVVFAMPELAWDEYFGKSRSLESWAERLQFGILKPWTELRSFGLIFWLLLPAAWLGIRWAAEGRWRGYLGGPGTSPADRLLPSAGFILLCFWAGMTASTLLGMDLMIKNDRYMLIVLPCAALVAGWMLARIFASASWIDDRVSGWRDHARAVGVAALSAVLVLLWTVSTAVQHGRTRQLGLSLGDIVSLPHEDKLRYWSGFQLARELSTRTPPDALVLAERPADLYYSDRRMISFLDPRLVPVYRERDPARAVQMLVNLGVTHLQMPGYSHPAIYRTALQEIAARPDLSTLLFASQSDQLYLLGSEAGHVGTVRQLGPAFQPWVQSVHFLQRPLGVMLSSAAMEPSGYSRGGLSVHLMQRGIRTELAFGESPDLRGVQNRHDLIPVTPARDLLVELDLEGDAYAVALIYYFDVSRRPAVLEGSSSDAIGEIALSPEAGRRALMRRVRIARADVAFIRIVIEHRGNTTVRILDARVTDLHPAEPGKADLE